jgi:uncharacterized protein YndB with AHSA1/START domain
MKKVLYGILTALTLGLLGLYIYAFTSPADWTVEHSRTVRADANTVYATLEDLETWPEWSSWGPKSDATAEWKYGEATTGEGASAGWSGEQLGEGRIELTRADSPKRIEYKLWFAGRDEPSSGIVTLSTTKSGTTIEWVDRGGVGGNPLLRLLVPQIQRQLSDDIERSLIRFDERL